MSSRIKELAATGALYKRRKISKIQYQQSIQRINDRYDSMETVYAIDPGNLVNISKEPWSYEWYIDERVKDNKVSVAEKMVAGLLDRWYVDYVPEVSMKGLTLPSGGSARFDWLLKVGNPYILCEYDGQQSHSTEYQKARDALKNRWCMERGIRLLRWSAKDYYHMEDRIESLMKEYHIRKK